MQKDESVIINQEFGKQIMKSPFSRSSSKKKINNSECSIEMQTPSFVDTFIANETNNKQNETYMNVTKNDESIVTPYTHETKNDNKSFNKNDTTYSVPMKTEDDSVRPDYMNIYGNEEEEEEETEIVLEGSPIVNNPNLKKNLFIKSLCSEKNPVANEDEKKFSVMVAFRSLFESVINSPE